MASANCNLQRARAANEQHQSWHFDRRNQYTAHTCMTWNFPSNKMILLLQIFKLIHDLFRSFQTYQLENGNRSAFLWWCFFSVLRSKITFNKSLRTGTAFYRNVSIVCLSFNTEDQAPKSTDRLSRTQIQLLAAGSSILMSPNFWRKKQIWKSHWFLADLLWDVCFLFGGIGVTLVWNLSIVYHRSFLCSINNSLV